MIARKQLGLGAVFSVAALATLAGPTVAAAQSDPASWGPDRVLAFPAPVGEERLDVDRGALGAWHRIRKLATTASLLHVTAHPDDEHSGMLTLASRGWGARTALLSINRGEAGANAIGPELFDALGLIRTRELVLSGRYYGLDDLYFTTAVDYGYSKSVDEAFRSWDREAVLEDMVRVIRLNRPLVVVSRFHGSPRDGHGHHHAAGLLTPEAVAAAADPTRFPRQITEEGLRPWRVLRTFRGGVRVGEPFHVEVDASGASPWLGDTYQRWASRGLGLQRSQTAGRVRSGGGRYFYERLDGSSGAPAVAAETADSFFAGLDTTIRGLPALLDEAASPEADSLLAEGDRLVTAVTEAFDLRDPGLSVADLARGLGLIRAAIAATPDAPDTRFHLSLKERQFEEALLAASGTTVSAELAGAAGSGEAVLVPGQLAAVLLSVEPAESAGVAAWIESRSGEILAPSSRVARRPDGSTEALEIRVPATPAAPYFGRADVSENHYQVSDSADLHLPWRRPALAAGVELDIGGHVLAHTVPVTAPVSRLPYGSVTRRVETLPVLSVSLEPGVGIVPVDAAGSDGGPPGESAEAPMEVRARVTANSAPVSATVRLDLPEGWSTTFGSPGIVEHDFRSPGEILDAAFFLTPPDGWRGEAEITAVARVEGGEGVDYRRGYRTIEHRDLALARLWRPAWMSVRSVPVTRLSGVRIGYVMGVGDEVPAGIEALGATVELLDETALAGLDPATGTDSGDGAGFHAIVVGTRAYAVREDLVEHNQRLLEYARRGGHLVVLYQTQEYVPSAMAPYPASLPRGAEEVSEEDAPVRLLRPDHPVMVAPNRLTEADFDGWIEQRGSKFFTEWDPAYTPLVETHDTGQAPQEGVWLTAPVGEGRYTYLALALHRQLPYGVPGAFRILSNVLSWR